MVPPNLSKDKIVRAALELLDEVGLDGLTVRALASRLSVQAPALYWHVKNKSDLLDEMASFLWQEIGAVVFSLPPDTAWDTTLTTFARTVRRVILAHRDGARVFSGTYLTDDDLLRRQEDAAQAMLRQGFTLRDVVRSYALVYNFTIGFCIEEQAVAQAPDDRYALDRRARRIDPDSRQAAPDAVGPEIFGDPDSRFDDLLALLVDTAARLRGGHDGANPAEAAKGDGPAPSAQSVG